MNSYLIQPDQLPSHTYFLAFLNQPAADIVIRILFILLAAACIGWAYRVTHKK